MIDGDRLLAVGAIDPALVAPDAEVIDLHGTVPVRELLGAQDQAVRIVEDGPQAEPDLDPAFRRVVVLAAPADVAL